MAPAVGTIVVIGRAPGLRLVNNAGMESARTRKSEALGIAAGTLKNGPDVYCVENSEILR